MKKYIRYFQTQLNYLTADKSIEFKPVFLIGCGRSGTTILGRTLGKHKSVTYLNERRDLWHKAYPDFDIWTDRVKTPKLIADRSNHDEQRTQLLRRLFHKEQIAGKGDVLLEKLPINNFRLDFLHVAFPEAKYIYLHRNGLEVANSIEKLSLNGRWFGKNNLKWKLIEELISQNTEIQQKQEFSYFEKGLLEWRFSLDFSENFFAGIDQNKVYSLSYKSFLDDPVMQISNIFDFLNLENSDNQIAEFTADIERRSKIMNEPTKDQLQLGGKLLPLSIQNELRQTVPIKEIHTS